MSFWLILGIVGFYFLAILASIVVARVRETGKILSTPREFFLAKRTLPFWVLALTYVGSLYSAFTVVGIPGLFHTHGIAGPGYMLLSSVIITPFIYWKLYPKLRSYSLKYDLLSPIGILRHGYDSKLLGVVAAVIFIGFLSPYLSLQLVGLGKMVEVITDGQVSYTLGVGSMMLVVLCYVLVGGMRAVAYTDVVQAVAILIAIIGGSIVLVSSHFGDITRLIKEVPAAHLSLPGPVGYFTTATFMSYLVFAFFSMLWPHIMTRVMMAPDTRAVRRMILLKSLFALLAFSSVTVVGMVLVVLYPDMPANAAGGMFYKALEGLGGFGAIMAVLLLIGILGAAMSTADSVLLTVSQMATRDVVAPYRKMSDQNQVYLARVVMALLLVIAFVVGLNPPTLMVDLALYAMKGAGLFAPLYFGLTWQRRTAFGGVCCLVGGTLVMLGLGLNDLKPYGIDETIWAYAVGWSGYLLCAVIKHPRQVS